jgi:decaprenyl-phosphate phosphoribosyltransferase
VTAGRWLAAVVRTTRPRQWPKNLLVFAAPLAGATLGRPDGLGYAAAAAVAFGCASAAVYLVNDVVDAERDRRHPVKRHRPIASGALSGSHAVALAVVAAFGAIAIGAALGVPLLVAAAVAYLCTSFLYSARLKHVPFVELALVASGFLLRVLGGAAATHVPVSVWFLLVCSLGALFVAIAKRYAELATLGPAAARHRPAMRGYRPGTLRFAQVAVAASMLAMYLLWASGESDGTRAWHLASTLPLALAIFRFGTLTGRRTMRSVEEMITGDGPMIACELAWLGLFCVGLAT